MNNPMQTLINFFIGTVVAIILVGALLNYAAPGFADTITSQVSSTKQTADKGWSVNQITKETKKVGGMKGVVSYATSGN